MSWFSISYTKMSTLYNMKNYSTMDRIGTKSWNNGVNMC